jgi:multiple sugar transport system ATP-binding protein
VNTIRLDRIAKQFGATNVLKSVSLAVSPGEFVVLVGPSGCGKSTLLRIVAGIEQPNSGKVWIGERDVTHARPARRDVAMVFQSYALYPHLTVAENIAVPLAMRRLNAAQRLPLIGRLLPGAARTGADIRRDACQIAESLGLGALLDRKPAQLSGGQRQRVALARAIVREPAAFLMDEPLSNLDASMRTQARLEIVDIHRRVGASTVYVTHDQAEALTMADRVAVMHQGEILQFAPPEIVYREPADLRVATFIGAPRINTLPAQSDARGVVRIAGQPAGIACAVSGEVTLAVRPEHLALGPRGMPARVVRLEFLGESLLLHARHLPTGTMLVARIEPGQRSNLPADGQIHLDFAPGDALLFDRDGRRIPADAMSRVHENV